MGPLTTEMGYVNQQQDLTNKPVILQTKNGHGTVPKCDDTDDIISHKQQVVNKVKRLPAGVRIYQNEAWIQLLGTWLYCTNKCLEVWIEPGKA